MKLAPEFVRRYEFYGFLQKNKPSVYDRELFYLHIVNSLILNFVLYIIRDYYN